MVDKININENIKKKDLELILEVNKKAIEIETAVADQNEDIITSLTDIRKTQVEHDLKIDKLIKQSEETNRDIFKIQVLFLTGLLSLVIQIIQIFIIKK
jgi:Asp-tRNA(Asn)/Glu-tRNA(Gln) amidotransferase C subunit